MKCSQILRKTQSPTIYSKSKKILKNLENGFANFLDRYQSFIVSGLSYKYEREVIESREVESSVPPSVSFGDENLRSDTIFPSESSNEGPLASEPQESAAQPSVELEASDTPQVSADPEASENTSSNSDPVPPASSPASTEENIEPPAEDEVAPSGERILQENNMDTPANIEPVDDLTIEYFADYYNEEEFQSYFRKRKIPNSIFGQGDDSPSSMWVSLIIIMFILFIVCFSQNCGHLINEKMVLSRACCAGGPTTTLMKKSLIALAIVTCFFSGIYFLINITHDYESGKTSTLKSVEKALTDSVIQTVDDGELTWTNDIFFSPNYDGFKEEEQFKNKFLTELILDKRGINGELVRLNSSLIEKSNSMFERVFNMPLVIGNKAIRLPLYEQINEIDDENFMFKDALAKYLAIAAKYSEISKSTSPNGGLRDFFSLPAEIEEAPEDSQGNPVPVPEPPKEQKSLFNDYYNGRKNFVIEYGYQGRNVEKILRNYYDDKVNQFEGFDNLNKITFFTCLVCTAITVLIVALRLDNVKNCLVIQWFPVLLVSLILAYNCAKLIGFGGILYTGCSKLEKLSQNFNISSTNGTHTEIKSKEIDYSLTPKWTPRSTIEMQVLSPPLIDNFKEHFRKCGLQIEENFNQPLLNEMIDHKVNYYSFFEQNQNKFDFDKHLADETSLGAFYDQVVGYHNFSDPYFDKTTYADKDQYDNSIFPTFDILTSLTSYEMKNSIQKDKGECSRVRDQWVLQEKDCHADYPFVENTGEVSEATFVAENVRHRACFKLVDWSVANLTARYSGAFHGCKKIKNGTDSDGNEITAHFEEFTIKYFTDAQVFINMVLNSLNHTETYFLDLLDKYRVVNKTTYELSTALDREAKYIEQLSESLLIFNQSNSCDFVPKHVVELYNNFCIQEMKSADQYYQSFSIIAITSLTLSIILGILGCGFYNNPVDPLDYREMEMETVDNFGGMSGKISYVSMNSFGSDFD